MSVRKICLGWNSAQEWIQGENTNDTSFVALSKDEGDQEHSYQRTSIMDTYSGPEIAI